MRAPRRLPLAFLAAGLPGAAGGDSPDYARDVVPIVKQHCLVCHTGVMVETSGKLRMESLADLLKGGVHGPAIVPGRSAESLLVKRIEGTIQPKMPLQGSLPPEQVALIKAWIDAGAPAGAAPGASVAPPVGSAPAVSIAAPVASLPDIAPRKPVPAPVDATAFRPDGKAFAVGGYKEVRIVDAARGSVTTWPGGTDLVRALAWSPDGRFLAAAGGLPLQSGEVVIFDAAAARPARRIAGHSDAVGSVAWSPDGTLIATGSYDKLVKLWDAAGGREVRTLKEHTDAVFPVAFSPDGRTLASGGGDRTVKLWDVATGRRLYTLSDPLDSVYAVAFHPSGRRLAAGGADKMIRIWDLAADGGSLVQALIAHDDAVLALAWSPDGRALWSAAADRLVKRWDAAEGRETAVLEPQPDWPQAIALSPDGRDLAVGRLDGSAALYATDTARKRLEPPLSAARAPAVPAPVAAQARP